MATNFTIEGRRLANLPDLQKTWMWEWVVMDANKIDSVISDSEDLIIRCRTASIPSRGTEVMESNFMGMKQYFMGKPVIESNISTTFEETEDQKVMHFLYAWRQAMFNVNPVEGGDGIANVGMPGASLFDKKRNLAKTCYLKMYKSEGTLLPYMIKFVNTWPENVDAVSLDYGSNEGVKYNVNWKFDFWQLVKTSG